MQSACVPQVSVHVFYRRLLMDRITEAKEILKGEVEGHYRSLSCGEIQVVICTGGIAHNRGTHLFILQLWEVRVTKPQDGHGIPLVHLAHTVATSYIGCWLLLPKSQGVHYLVWQQPSRMCSMPRWNFCLAPKWRKQWSQSTMHSSMEWTGWAVR